MTALRLILATVIGCAADGLGSSTLESPLVLTQIPLGTPASATSGRTDRPPLEDWFARARIVLVSRAFEAVVLSKGFESACDPDVSHDGRRILFAGKRTRIDPWAIWEIGIDGGNLRRVAVGKYDCRSPIYGARLFTLDAPAPWATILYVGRNAGSPQANQAFSTSLYAANLDGSESHRITFNPEGDFDPFQMWDGRVLYAARLPPSDRIATKERSALFAVNIDGTDHELYTTAPGPGTRSVPCGTERGLIVFVESDAPTWDRAGQLASVRERRPHHTYRKLTEDAGFAFLYPSPLTNNTVLVSRRSLDANSTWGVHRFDADTGLSEAIFDSPDYHDLQAKPVRARTIPDGRSTPVDPAQRTGILYGLNCYDADPRLQGRLTPGVIRGLRVIEGLPACDPESGKALAHRIAPTPNPARPNLTRRLLGEAPVEPDGSFHVEIPADIPVELQAIDEHGMALATCRWIWVKPKEKRGCIGCHEDPERIPENQFVSAIQRAANQLTLPPERRRSVGFREHVLPILRTKCATADCHGGNETQMRMTTTAGIGVEDDGEILYRALTGFPEAGKNDRSTRRPAAPYVIPSQARASYLTAQILGRRIGLPWIEDGSASELKEGSIKKMPPADAHNALTREEVRTIVEWIDLGAQWETTTNSTSHTGKPEPASQ